jgi:hypothetical protein
MEWIVRECASPNRAHAEMGDPINLTKVEKFCECERIDRLHAWSIAPDVAMEKGE